MVLGCLDISFFYIISFKIKRHKSKNISMPSSFAFQANNFVDFYFQVFRSPTTELQ